MEKQGFNGHEKPSLGRRLSDLFSRLTESARPGSIVDTPRDRQVKIVVMIPREGSPVDLDNMINAAYLVKRQFAEVQFVVAMEAADTTLDEERLDALGLKGQMVVKVLDGEDSYLDLARIADLVVASSTYCFSKTMVKSRLSRKKTMLVSRDPSEHPLPKNAIGVDFWDARKMAEMIACCLSEPGSQTHH